MNARHEMDRAAAKAAIARRMTREGLEFAVADCRAAITAGVEPDRYRDEIALYRAEIARRTR